MQTFLISISAAVLLASACFIGSIMWIAAGEADVNGDPENDSKQ